MVPREFEKDEITGVIKEPDALKAARAKRPTEERLERLETKYDGIAKDLADIKGEMRVWPQLVATLERLVTSGATAHAEADKLEAAADFELAKARAGVELELAKARAAAELEMGKQKAAADAAAAADQIEANKTKRGWIDKLFTKVLFGASLAAAAVLAAIQARGC